MAAFAQAVKLQTSLATRLRLAPSARTDPKTAARQQVYSGPKPWLDDDGEGPWHIRRNGSRHTADKEERNTDGA